MRKRIFSTLLAVIMLIGLLPMSAFAVDGDNTSAKVVDDATVDGYKSILGTTEDGARYAGRVWTDKSVYTTVPTLDSINLEEESGGTNLSPISLENNEFLTVFSALGSSRVINDVQTTPIDLVITLDVSTSMANTANENNSRIYHSIEAVNDMISKVMALNDQSRVGVVAFGDAGNELLPLGHYSEDNGEYLTISGYSYAENGTGTYGFTVSVNVQSAEGTAVQESITSIDYTSGNDSDLNTKTHTQAGLYQSMEMLATESSVTAEVNGVTVDRTPVVVLVSDGVPTAFSAADNTNWSSGSNSPKNADWWNFSNALPVRSSLASKPARLLATLLTASYEKNKIEKHYNVTPKVFTIALDLSEDDSSYAYGQAVLDPSNGFTEAVLNGVTVNNINQENSGILFSDSLPVAYDAWQKYSSDSSDNVPVLVGRSTSSGGSGTGNTNYYYYSFNHPSDSDVSSVNYVDKHFGVENSVEDLYDAFEEILTEATDEAFVPTEDTTGDEQTGIMYTDPLGEYMTFKSLNGVLIDGKVVPVTRGTDGEYTATIPTGEKHPIYGTDIGGMEIRIKVISDSNGKETVQVQVPSAILPAQGESITVDKDGNATISTEKDMPLRVLYTVGLKNGVLGQDGKIVVGDNGVSQDYVTNNTTNGQVYFYSNEYNKDTNNGYGDAKVEFSPSDANRYYYFQTNRVIYTSITKGGESLSGQQTGTLKIEKSNTTTNGEYAVSNPVTSVDSLVDDTYYYLVIDYYRPTSTEAKDSNGNTLTDSNKNTVYEAEHVYQVVSRTGKDLKNSVESVPHTKKGLVTGGEEIGTGNVVATVIGAPRLGRMSWFTEQKSGNPTGTATHYYVPTYTGATSNESMDDLIDDNMGLGEAFTVYLGNNGRLAVDLPGYEVKVEYYLAGENSNAKIDTPQGYSESFSMDAGETWSIATSGSPTYTAPKSITITTQDQEGNEVKTTYAYDAIATETVTGNKLTGNGAATVQLVYSVDTQIDTSVPEDNRPKDGGDGIPDNCQVTINYVVAEGSIGKGNVNKTTEVLTVGGVENPAQSGNVTISGATATPVTGYTFQAWTKDTKITSDITTSGAELSSQDIPVTGGETYTFTASFANDTNTTYTVQHYQQNLAGDGYELKDTETLTGTTGTTATATAKSYEGFTYNESASGTVTSAAIAADGSTVLKLYYDRQTYNVQYQYSGDAPAGASALPATTTYKYGATVNVATAATATGYTFSGWTTTDASISEGQFTMPAKDVTLTGSWSAGDAPEVSNATKQITKINNNAVADVGDESVQEGDVITYQVSFSSQAQYFSVEDARLPDSESDVTVNNGGKKLSTGVSLDTSATTRTLLIDLGSVPTEAATITVEYAYTVTKDDMAEDKVSNTATVNAWIDPNTKGAPDPQPTAEVNVDKYDITKIEKELVKSAESLPEGVTLPSYETDDNDNVIVPNSGSITLLYKITVTGEPKATFTVTDENATLVSDSVTGNNGTFTGTIPTAAEGATTASVEFYVTKSFQVDDIDTNGNLTNTATVNPGDDSEKPNDFKDKGEEKTPATPASAEVTKAPVTTTTDLSAVTWTAGKAPDYIPVTDGKIELPNSETGVTLLYAVTVTSNGVVNKTVKLTDEGAKYVGATTGTAYTVTEGDSNDTVTVSFTNAGVAVVYFTKTETASIGTSLTNSVIVNSDEDNPINSTPVSVDKGEVTINKSVADKNGTAIGTNKVQVGDELTYTITLTNTNDVPVEVTFADVMTATKDGDSQPREITINDVSKTDDGYTVTVPANGKKEITYTYTVTADDVGYTLKNAATVKGNDGEDGPEDDVTVEVAKPGLNVNKTVTSITKADGTTAENTATANVGDTIKWTITVKNTGETDLSNITVNDELAATGSLTVESNVLSDVISTETDGTFTITSLASNASVEIPVSYTVLATDVGKKIINTATAKAGDNGPDDTGTSEVTVPDPNRALTVTKKVDKTHANVGDTLTYTITVKNNCDYDLTNVTVTDTMLNVNETIGIEANKTWTKDYTYTVQSSDAGKTIVNTAIATVDGKEYQDSSDGTTIPKPSKPTNPTKPVEPTKPVLNTEDHVAYIIGYEDETVRPGNNITRAEVATIFFRLLTDESRQEFWSTTNSYTDVAEGAWYNNAISTLSEAGIINGYADGSFRPNATITRAEFATIAARFSDVVYDGSNQFTDVPDSHWAARYIALAEHLGWINGYEDHTFKPEQPITRAESMTLINRVLERAVEEDHMLPDMVTWIDNQPSTWYYEAVQEATNSHEYVRTEDQVPNLDFNYEDWQKILEVPDWAALEQSWSDWNSASGTN